MSYQPEERYWTDYLRIALPVIGLLLMLGLFWFWASSLIQNDDSGNAPTATPKGQVAVVSTVTGPTAAATKPAVVLTTPQTAPTATPTKAAAQQQQGQTGQTNNQQPQSTAAAANSANPTAGTTSTAGAAQFTNGQVVATTDTVNMRDAPSTNGNVITPLDPGTQLTITGPPQSADGYTWYPVKDVNGDTGYVAGELLQASSGQ